MRRLAVVVACLLCCFPAAAAARRQAHGKQKTAIIEAIRRAHDIGRSQKASCMRVYVSTVNRNWAEMQFIFVKRCERQDANGVSVIHRVHGRWRFVTAGSAFSCPIPGHIPRRVQRDLRLSCARAAIGGASAAPRPQRTVRASLITRARGTLAPGSRVRSARLSGLRTFTDAKHGFALAGVGSAQYPAASVDGGKTWRTDGPALHLDAAQAPLAVANIGAAGRKTVFAWGGGQVIDTTRDGGRHWYRALFQGVPLAVVRDLRGHLVAFVDQPASSSSSRGVTWQYVSKDGGRSWRYDTTVGGS